MSHPTHSKAPTQRQLRVGEEIRHALSDIFLRGGFSREPALDVPITVSEVRIGPDLKHATAYVMPLGGLNSEGVLQALHRAAPGLRYEVSKRVKLRHSPQIHFKLDHSFDEAHRIEKLLKRPEVARDLKKVDE